MQPNYLLLPGNPPAVHFYELWKNEIEARCPQARVKVSHYPILRLSNDSEAIMKEVAEAHHDQLRRFHEEIGRPVTLIGHSLGAYFSLRLLEMAGDRIRNALFVHPFLRMPTFGGRVILRAAGTFHSFERFQKVLVRSRRSLELFSSELANVSDEEMIKSLHLARHESRTIGGDRSPLVIPSALRSKIQVFYAKDDIWCPSKTVSELSRQVQARECPEPHGFVTVESHRRSLFERILESDRT